MKTHAIQSSLVVLFSLSIASGPVDAGTRAGDEFLGHAFTLELPDGYFPFGAASLAANARTFGFATEARTDGTRGMIQVTLAAHGQTEAPAPEDIPRIADSLIAAVRARRSDWKSTERDEELGGVAVRRVEWSGLSDVPVERDGRPVRVPMSGIMIVGVKGTLVFALHTQDMAPFAAQANPLAERAMRTFDLQPQ